MLDEQKKSPLQLSHSGDWRHQTIIFLPYPHFKLNNITSIQRFDKGHSPLVLGCQVCYCILWFNDVEVEDGFLNATEE